MTGGLLNVSNELFGLRYVKREDIQSYHPGSYLYFKFVYYHYHYYYYYYYQLSDVDTYEVRETLGDGTDKLVMASSLTEYKLAVYKYAYKYKSSVVLRDKWGKFKYKWGALAPFLRLRCLSMTTTRGSTRPVERGWASTVVSGLPS